MSKSQYKECHRTSDVDNAWLEYYSTASIENKQTKHEERTHDYLGYKYTDDDSWYYQWDNDEKHWYVVVDKEA